MSSQNRSQEPSVGARCEHCGSTASPSVEGIVRCACGSLLARYVDGMLELKCRRCKRTVMVSAGASTEGAAG